MYYDYCHEIAESGDGGEVVGGGHDGEGDGGESKLKEAEGEPTRGPGHPLHVLHPHPRRMVLCRLSYRRRLHRVNRWPARKHLDFPFLSTPPPPP